MRGRWKQVHSLCQTLSLDGLGGNRPTARLDCLCRINSIHGQSLERNVHEVRRAYWDDWGRLIKTDQFTSRTRGVHIAKLYLFSQNRIYLVTLETSKEHFGILIFSELTAARSSLQISSLYNKLQF